MEIRFKDGLPLMVGGLVAGSQSCCCENPPPPGCGCGDYCQYFIEVVSPESLAVKSLPVSCDPAVSSGRSVNPLTVLPGVDCEPAGWDFVGAEGVEYRDSASAGVSLFGDSTRIGMGAFATQAFGGFKKTFSFTTPFPRTSVYGIGGQASIGVRIFCDSLGEVQPEPKFYALVDFAAFFSVGNALAYRWHQRTKTARYELPSYCAAAGAASCDGDYQKVFLSTPLDITAGGTTTSLGEYQNDTVIYNSREQIVDFAGEEAGEYIDCVIDALTATFLITARPDCRTPIPCDCSASLAGTTWTFDSREFTFGTEQEIWDGPNRFYFDGLSFVMHEYYDPDGPTDGDGNPSRFLWRRQADVYCAFVEGEPTWVVLLRATCAAYDAGWVNTGVTTDTWFGRLDCYAGCADDWRSAGDPIPSGVPQDVVFDNRETIGDECSPPGRGDLVITQIAEC